MLLPVTDAKKLVCNKHSQHPWGWGLEDEERDDLACVLTVAILFVLPVASQAGLLVALLMLGMDAQRVFRSSGISSAILVSLAHSLSVQSDHAQLQQVLN